MRVGGTNKRLWHTGSIFSLLYCDGIKLAVARMRTILIALLQSWWLCMNSHCRESLSLRKKNKVS